MSHFRVVQIFIGLGGFQADPVGLLLDQQVDQVITSESAPRAGVVYVPLFGFEMLTLLPHGHPLAQKMARAR